jgi:hypothetical protein
MSEDSEIPPSDQIALALAALGASFAQVLCDGDPSLHHRLVQAATRNCRMLDAHGEGLAADLLRAFLNALNDREMFPGPTTKAQPWASKREAENGDPPAFAGPRRARTP